MMSGSWIRHCVGCGLAMLAIAWGLRPLPAQQTGPIATPTTGQVLRISLALKDRQPTRWDGQLELSAGKLLQLSVEPAACGKATGSRWQAQSRKPGKRQQPSVHDPKLPALLRPVLVAAIDAPPGASVSVRTAQGDFAVAIDQLQPGRPKLLLGGQVRVERLPLTVQLTDLPGDEDLPAAARGPDGTVWVAYLAYQHAQPLDLEAIHQRRQFDSLVAGGHGDRIQLLRFDGKSWSTPLDVTDPRGRPQDLWRPAVAVDGQGRVWVVYSRNDGGNWDLVARAYQPKSDSWTETIRLTTDPGADINPVAVTDPRDGRVHIVWQGWRSGSFDILLATLDDGKPTGETAVAAEPGNQWCPSAAVRQDGTLCVAYDTYERGNYDVRLVVGAGRASPRKIDVAASPRYEARPSIAVDRQGQVWVAYEEAGVNWGKDTGMKWMGPRGQQLYFQRELVVRMVNKRQVRQVSQPVPCEPIARNYPDAQTRRMSLPRLAFDAAGRLWLAYRRHPNRRGGGENWASFVTHWQQGGWAEPVQLAHSTNLMDNRPALVPLADQGLLIVHSSDGRTGGTRTAKENNLYCSVVRTSGQVATAQLVRPPEVGHTVLAVHPNEAADVERIRGYRATVGGKTYRVLRGEFHRHTELTSHRDQDGTLEEMWRYALDAAQLDWIGNGDHDNGYGVEYLWWLVQKQTDIYHHPPVFMPMFTYERSVSYPSGHRNAMFARRGIRPLPRMPGGKANLYGTPEEGSPDIKNFYAYLKRFGGICASHTSGTNMGTDWRDNDPEVEPVVEIYQGLRQSYEHEHAPATARDAADSIGGYRPLGFVWNALMKGYRLGFEVSSDHYSTHISYSMVYAEDASRQAILDGLKRRHSYGANDNIILDVRCGDHMMGDVFTVQGKPAIDITVIGTQPIARLSIIRGVGSDPPQYVYETSPGQQQVRLRWVDQNPAWNQTAYYYVRIEQVPPAGGYGALAWASPMWITASK